MVREWLLKQGYDQIWFKAHTNKSDLVFTQKGNYLATDLWNLFDGICWLGHRIVFLDLKTNNWGKKVLIEKFLENKAPNITIVSFNVSNKLKGTEHKLKDGSLGKIRKWKVFVRRYP